MECSVYLGCKQEEGEPPYLRYMGSGSVDFIVKWSKERLIPKLKPEMDVYLKTAYGIFSYKRDLQGRKIKDVKAILQGTLVLSTQF